MALFDRTLDVVSAAQRNEDLHRLRSLLQGFGIKIELGSALESAIQTTSLPDWVESKGLRNTRNNRDRYRRWSSLAWYAEQILLASQNNREFPALLGHIQLLARAKSYAHCIDTPTNSEERQLEDHLFELQVALGLYPWAMRVKLESPRKSNKGKNPDVLFEFLERRWGFACKNLRSKNPKRFRGQLKSGIKQLKAASVAHGVIFVNLTNVVDHGHFFEIVSESPETGVLCRAWTDPKGIAKELEKVAFEQLQLGSKESSDAISELRDQNPSLSFHIVLRCSTIGAAIVNGIPSPTLTDLILHGDARNQDVAFSKLFEFYRKASSIKLIG